MYESKQWESKFNKAMSFWQQDRDAKYKALNENDQIKRQNKYLVDRNAELNYQCDKTTAESNMYQEKLRRCDEMLKAYDKAQGQSTGHCLSGNYKVTTEALNKTKKRK